MLQHDTCADCCERRYVRQESCYGLQAKLYLLQRQIPMPQKNRMSVFVCSDSTAPSLVDDASGIDYVLVASRYWIVNHPVFKLHILVVYVGA